MKATTEKTPGPADELARLEKMHQRMKDEQEAWRKLLESLEYIKQKSTPKPQNEQPSK